MKVYKRKARNDIYQKGVRTPAENKQGYTTDRSKPKDAEDKLLVQKGQTYYIWYPRNSERISLTYPDKRQLTQNAHKLQMYDFEDMQNALSDCTSAEDFAERLENFKSEIENYKEDLESRLDSMPEQLQETSTAGETLRERIDALEEAYNELDGIDTDYDEDADEIDSEALEEYRNNNDADDDEEELSDEEIRQTGEYNSIVERLQEEKLQAWLSEKIEEAQSVGLE